MGNSMKNYSKFHLPDIFVFNQRMPLYPSYVMNLINLPCVIIVSKHLSVCNTTLYCERTLDLLGIPLASTSSDCKAWLSSRLSLTALSPIFRKSGLSFSLEHLEQFYLAWLEMFKMQGKGDVCSMVEWLSWHILSWAMPEHFLFH